MHHSIVIANLLLVLIQNMPASVTGYNSKTGDLLTMYCNKKGANADVIGTTKVHYALEYDAVLQINDTGVTILE